MLRSQCIEHILRLPNTSTTAPSCGRCSACVYSNEYTNRYPCGHTCGRKSKKAWSRLAWWLLDMCIVNAFQLWAIGKDAPQQLDFREELMHSLVKLLGSDREAVQASRGVNASVALAKEHYTVSVKEARDCAVCSRDSVYRTRTHYICAKCK